LIKNRKPNTQVQAHLQGTQGLTQKLTLQKSFHLPDTQLKNKKFYAQKIKLRQHTGDTTQADTSMRVTQLYKLTHQNNSG
jgi:hypothetical protein